jgi:hypothetical protein
VVGGRELERSGGECLFVCGVGKEGEGAFGALGAFREGMWGWWSKRGRETA